MCGLKNAILRRNDILIGYNVEKNEYCLLLSWDMERTCVGRLQCLILINRNLTLLIREPFKEISKSNWTEFTRSLAAMFQMNVITCFCLMCPGTSHFYLCVCLY